MGKEQRRMFEEVKIEDLKINPLEMFGKNWMALSTGNAEKFNAMTIAWGQIGSIWSKAETRIPHDPYPTVTVFVRPQRYTNELLLENDYFACSALPPELKKSLAYLGSCSGRNNPDKIKQSGLTPHFSDGTGYFEEAELVFICQKLYQGKLHETGFFNPTVVERNYPQKDFHDVYVGKIVKILAKK